VSVRLRPGVLIDDAQPSIVNAATAETLIPAMNVQPNVQNTPCIMLPKYVPLNPDISTLYTVGNMKNSGHSGHYLSRQPGGAPATRQPGSVPSRQRGPAPRPRGLAVRPRGPRPEHLMLRWYLGDQRPPTNPDRTRKGRPR
jgi:hypothetical protein